MKTQTALEKPITIEQDDSILNDTILIPNADNATEISTALQNAGLDWTVEKQPIFTRDGAEISRKYATVRSDLAFESKGVLGIVGEQYTVIQNAEAFGILDDVIARRLSDGQEAKYSSMLTTENGSRVIATVDLGEYDIVPNDRHKTFLTAVTSHDGNSTTRLMLIDFRLACFNALNFAVKQAKFNNSLISIHHTASCTDRLTLASKVLAGVGQSQEEFKVVLKELASRQMTTKVVRETLAKLFPIPKSNPESNRLESTKERIVAKRNKILELFESNDYNAVQSIRGTAYNFLNAYTEYVDHYQAVVQTQGRAGLSEFRIRQEKALFGDGALAKSKAFQVIARQELALRN